MSNVPYTYIIKHIPTNTFYYGCRWSQNCDPSDLWVNYFTSSEIVNKLLKEYGPDSFIYHVHRTFETTKECLAFERYYLKRIDAMRNDKFLNRSNGNGYYDGRGKEPGNKGKPNPHSKGTKLYNNGKVVGYFFEDQVPEGWVKGRLKQTWNKGKTAEDDIRIKNGSIKSGETQKINKKPVWNKNLKKEDHPSIQKYAKTLSIVNIGNSYKKKGTLNKISS